MRTGTLAVQAPSPALATLQRALEWTIVLGLLAHAAFLSVSVAGMQIGLAVVAGGLLLLRLTGRRVWTHSALDLPCLLLAAAAVASLALGALGGSPPVGWHEATLWRSVLAPPVLLSALQLGWPGEEDDRARRRLALTVLGVWAAASFLPSALAWVQFWTGLDPLHALGLRVEAVHAQVPVYPGRYAAVGFFRWYQRLAHNLLPPLCVAGAVALQGGLGRRWQALLGAAAAAAAAAVVLTLSRAAWASLVLAALLVALAGSRARRRLAVGVVLALTLGMGLHPGVRARIGYLLVPGVNDDRKAIWGVCREVVEQHPLTGVGWGNLPKRSAVLYDRLAERYPVPLPRAWCHDSFFSAWAEGGPLLFAALVAFFALLVRAYLRTLREGDRLARAASIGALAAVVTLLLNALVHDVLYSSEAMFGFGFALAVASALIGAPPAPARPPGAAAAGGR